MHFSLLPVSMLLSLAVAQTTTFSAPSTSVSVCAAQPVLDQCLASTQAIVTGCVSTDYDCLCSKWNDVLTCFNQCPNDSRKGSTQSSVDTFCADASVYTSSTTSIVSAPVSSSFAATTTMASGAGVSTNSAGVVQTASSTHSPAATATGKSAGEMLGVNGGLVLGLAGLVGAFL